MSKEKRPIRHTAYDDAFRTLEAECESAGTKEHLLKRLLLKYVHLVVVYFTLHRLSAKRIIALMICLKRNCSFFSHFSHLTLKIKWMNDKRGNVSRKVGDIMGGRVLKMDWLEKYDAAVANGRAKGRAEGDQARLITQVCRKGKAISQIAEELEEDETRIKVICDSAARFAPNYDEEQVINAILDPVST